MTWSRSIKFNRRYFAAEYDGMVRLGPGIRRHPWRSRTNNSIEAHFKGRLVRPAQRAGYTDFPSAPRDGPGAKFAREREIHRS